MPPKVTELRCSTCGRLLVGLSSDFQGEISGWCNHCKSDHGHPDLVSVPKIRLNCLCGGWLAQGVIRAGEAWVKCRREGVLIILTPGGPIHADLTSAKPPIFPKVRVPAPKPPIRFSYPPPTPQSPEVLVMLIEERWKQHRSLAARRNAEIAVGLRFDVFTRDGFRCRYCGRGPAQGCYLEADHVVPRSAGGTDTLANLVTACWDCNHGKSAKTLTGMPI
jgi:hypothetical protein